MKILFITPYPFNSAPSQRFRFEQYFGFFREQKIEVVQEPFLDEKTWKLFYGKGNLHKKIWGTLIGIVRRHLVVFKFREFDFLFMHREACLVGPAYFEWLYVKVFRMKVIFDFDDAIWLRDVSEANNSLAWLKWSSKTERIIRYAAFVSAGNQYLLDFAKKFNPNGMVIPTTIDLAYHINNQRTAKEKSVVTIGWTGSVTTNRHFEMLLPVLKKIKEKYGEQVDFITISNKETNHAGLPVTFKTWSKDTEISDLAQIDIGIMPLPDDEWSNGKCGFKGLQYMALEIPTVMSPVGVNKEIIRKGENGFLAAGDEEWIRILSELIESAALRGSIGKAGKATIEEKYSVAANKQKYLELFAQLSTR